MKVSEIKHNGKKIVFSPSDPPTIILEMHNRERKAWEPKEHSREVGHKAGLPQGAEESAGPAGKKARSASNGTMPDQTQSSALPGASETPSILTTRVSSLTPTHRAHLSRESTEALTMMAAGGIRGLQLRDDPTKGAAPTTSSMDSG